MAPLYALLRSLDSVSDEETCISLKAEEISHFRVSDGSIWVECG